MRPGALVSAIAHATVVAWVLTGIPKPFDPVAGDAVAVDLVTPEEIKAEEQKPVEPPKPESEREPEKPLLIPPRPTKVTQTPMNAVPSAPASTPRAAAAPPPGQPQPAAAPPQAKQAQRMAAAPAPAAPAAPAPAPSPPPSTQHAAPSQQAAPSIFEPAAIPKLKEMTPDPGPATVALGYDGPADPAAESGRREVATVLAHLRKCLRLPAGVDPGSDLRIVMRVLLKPDGALAADPTMVSGPAVQEGPLLVQAAASALKQCQPYALPAETYKDWKMMDLTLRPRDMTGG